jgi:hypothetical protein
MSKYLFIAKAVHHVNNKICELNGEQTIVWEDMPEHMRQGLINAVQANLPPKEGHEAWLRNRLQNGWSLGAVKDIANKLSPCLVPYDELPYDQRIKDTVRLGIVEYLSAHVHDNEVMHETT